jgi:CheY-like chemotaxis protein
MANILLVATGGTRAPTQLELAERFIRDGHKVRLVASSNALRFLASHLARRLSKLPTYLSHYRPALRETLAYFIEKPKSVPHISEGKWADIAIMAPATCNSVGKLVAGMSDNYPLLVLRAMPRTKRVIVVPSMNPEMWYDPLFQRNIDLLNATEKYRVLCPTRGQMLSGDWGFGAQVPFEDIITETYRLLGILDPTKSAFEPVSHAVPWAEEGTPAAETHMVHVDPDPVLRQALADALQREYPDLQVRGFASARDALAWVRENPVAAVVTELDFEHGMTGLDLIQYLRRPGADEVQIIATSAHDRREVGAEHLGRLDVLFVPKPINLPFVVGMVAGTLGHGARRHTALATRRLEDGEVLFREGSRGTEVFVVRSGSLRITRQNGVRELEVGTADPGDMVGEIAFVHQAPRSATLTAVGPTEVAVLDLEQFRTYLEGQPAWLRTMLHSLVGHLRETSERLAEAQRTAAE